MEIKILPKTPVDPAARLMEHAERLENAVLDKNEYLERILRTANMKYNMTADSGWLDVYNWARRALEVN